MLYAYKMGHYSGISAVVRTQRAAVLEIANPCLEVCPDGGAESL